MGRRGWSAVSTPAGWYEVIRAPRPPSVQWPKGQGKGKGKIPEVRVGECSKVTIEKETEQGGRCGEDG